MTTIPTCAPSTSDERLIVTKRIAVLGLVLVAVAVAGCGASVDDSLKAAAPQSEESPSPATCVLPGSSNEPSRYGNLRELAEASHAVVEGTVTGKGPGAQAGHDRPLLYAVRTESVLAGADMPGEWSYVAGTFLENGCEVDFDGQGILAVGDRAVFFLAPPDQAGQYRQLLASQARYALEGDRVRDSKRDDALARQVESGSAAQLRSEVRRSGKGRPAG